MKKILFPILCCSLLQVNAQESAGTITYEEVLSLNIELDGDMEQFAAMLPKERKTKKLLHYTSEASVYTVVKSDHEEQNMSSNGVNMVIKMDEPDEITYTDLAADKMYQQKEFMGRKFLITGDVKSPDWKMTGQQKELLGYPCQEAKTIKDKDTISAWFTPAIPIASGPAGLGKLPGMILEITINNGLHITAVDIVGEIDKSKLNKPKGGKKVTSEEYQKIVTEKTKEMQAEYGGSGNRVIKMMVTEDR